MPASWRVETISLEPNPTIDAYKKDIDRTLVRENLKLTPEERVLKLQDFVRFVVTLQESGRKALP
jgi:hypothetical protein